MKKYKKCISVVLVVAVTFLFSISLADSAFANDIPKIGGSTGSIEDINDTIESLIWKIRIIGALVVVACIIIGFIIVGLSLGNAQKRAIGVSAVVCAAIAIYGIAKAPALANWIIDDSQKKITSIPVEQNDSLRTATVSYYL